MPRSQRQRTRHQCRALGTRAEQVRERITDE